MCSAEVELFGIVLGELAAKNARRGSGKLSPRVVAYVVMALALFADEDYEEVAARLAGTPADWDGWEEPWGRVPTSGRVVQARRRLDLEPMKAVLAGRQAGSDDGGGGGRFSAGRG